MDNLKFNTRTETWDYQKLVKLEPVSINRDTDSRITKVLKRLEKEYLPTHSIIYVAKITKPFGKYRKGEYCRLDGNTRVAVWSIRPDLVPNVPFTVIIFDIDNQDTLEKTYYSIDSMDAVEKGFEKITGLFREKGYTPKTKMFTGGKFGTAIEHACRYGYDDKGVYLNTANNKFQFNYYFKEICFIDKMGFEINKYYKRNSLNVLACLLMIGKKYGVNHPRFSLLIENFNNGITTINNTKYVDGVHYVYHTLFDKIENWKLSTYNLAPERLYPTLYAFDMFMNEKNISKLTKLPNNKELTKFYMEYNENYLKYNKSK